ncbi:MAG: DUF6064 family protein [Chloroflexota bacterium]|nr:DUF6064 family protein [Chloroflexota bacterium]
MQIVMYVLAGILTLLFFARPGTTTDRIIKAYLAFACAWIGVVFFLILGQDLPAHNAQAFLFLSIAVLFAVDLLIGKIEFRVPETRWHLYTAIFWFVMVFLYPVVGMLVGHTYPRMIILGTFPCPTVAFALVLMTTALPKVTKPVYFLLLLWAIPFPIFFQIPQFGVYEDSIMLVIGIYSFVALVKDWAMIGKEKSQRFGDETGRPKTLSG